ncbi:MAG: CoA-binding protein [Sulfolobales archaeon]|nr:CoA-binding protein [Sulfolobales archaeon]MDW8082187.1 CoA-binding protein [Sulfolobales archaeon]
MNQVEFFFTPKVVAVVGASRKPGKVGYELLKNLKELFKGNLYAINPEAREILGVPCYSTLLDIPEEVDVVVISVPAERVSEVAEEAGRKGVKGLIVISGGFKETGPEGAEREKKLVEIVKKYGMRLIGPNCVGVYVPKTGMNTLFLSKERQGYPAHGFIAFASQSGAFGSAVLDWAAMKGIGISKFVSYGNKADVDEVDVLLYLRDDEDTRVITLYVEGIEKGREFFKVLREVTKYKPVIVLKSGRTEAGARAASSHTGSLAGSDAIYDSIFKQSGAVRAYSMEELFDLAIGLATQPPAAGGRVAVLTVGGGSGVMATDALSELGLSVPRLSESTVGRLRKVLLPFASPYNPVDVTGSAVDEHLVEAIEILLTSDDKIDAVMWLPYYMVPGITPELNRKFLDRVRKVFRETGRVVPIVGVATGGSYTATYAKEAESMGIPMYISPERAARVIKALVDYGRWLVKVGFFKYHIEKFCRIFSSHSM